MHPSAACSSGIYGWNLGLQAAWPEPRSTQLTGLYLGFHRLHTLESVLHLASTSPSCNHSVLVPCGDYGSSGNLNLRFFSLSPSATLSHCVCVPCGWGHLRVDLVLESQTNIKREQAVGFILAYLRHRFQEIRTTLLPFSSFPRVWKDWAFSWHYILLLP